MRQLLVLCLLASAACYAGGDRAGEVQNPPPKHWKIPPAPPLTPFDALKTFKLPPGFRIEVVAAEPLVHEPVAMCFDADGRIYVAEMRNYMPDVDGNGESEPTGTIAVLEDTDGDGKMDKRTEFLKGLVLPRAVALINDMVLVGEPPKMWMCRDTDGDFVSNKKLVAFAGWGGPDGKPKTDSPEHTANGIMLNIDNWYYCSNWNARFRWLNGKLERESTISRGQWGLTHDDYGRMYFNTNSDQLRGDLIPAHYFFRNPNYKGRNGLNIQIAKDQSSWPSRITPGVNRGYQKGQLRDDGTLATVTAACGPNVYRGDNFPDDCRGNVFVCEPSGNFVKRNVISEKDGVITARNAYDKAEFLTSTDERFRPVNLYDGPDGALYVVDLYRGILQHRIFVTTFLKNQILERGLDKHMGLGRIYRVVNENKALVCAPKLSQETPAKLVVHLGSPNGWTRDMAQRLLVERGDPTVAPELVKMAATHESPFARLHALWTLDGINKLDEAAVSTALLDKDVKIRCTAIRLSEGLLKSNPSEALIDKLAAFANDPLLEVRWQAALTLSGINHPKADPVVDALLPNSWGNKFLRDAAFSGIGGRELPILTRLLSSPAFAVPQSDRENILLTLAASVMNERQPDKIYKLVEMVLAQPAEARWKQIAMLRGMTGESPASGDPREKIAAPFTKYRRPMTLQTEPAVFAKLRAVEIPDIQKLTAVFEKMFVWPGKPGVAEVKITPLTSDEQKRFELGKLHFSTLCAQCHQPTGQGEDGKAPSLLDSDWVLGSDKRLVRMVLHGLVGPIKINGAAYNAQGNLDMPAMGNALDDNKIAEILTYIRREWGHDAAPVDPADVSKIRAETKDRDDAWTEKELLKIDPDKNDLPKKLDSLKN